MYGLMRTDMRVSTIDRYGSDETQKEFAMKTNAAVSTLIAQRHWLGSAIPCVICAAILIGMTLALASVPLLLLGGALFCLFTLWHYLHWRVFRISITPSAVIVRTLCWHGYDVSIIPMTSIYQLRLVPLHMMDQMVSLHVLYQTGKVSYRFLVLNQIPLTGS
jgi:hypothetical protein